MALLEVDKVGLEKLTAIHDTFPYSLSQPREDSFGIAIYSKRPLSNASVKFFGLEDIPSLVAQITVHSQPVSIIATHTLPPIRANYFHWRNQQLAEITHYIQFLNTPTILLGDLNMTMWSPFHSRFVQDSGLRNARSGFGILPTWPIQIPFLYIPIDHCLVSSKIQIISQQTGSKIGSDHLPLITDLVINQ